MPLMLWPVAFVFAQSAVTFAAPAEPLAKLLPALGDKLGMRLDADKLAGAQIALVDVHGFDRNRLLDEIAAVTHGHWHPNRDGLLLTLDATEMRRLWQEDAARQAVWLGPALQSTSELPGRSADDRLNALSARKVATLVGVAALSAIKPGERVVYAPNPNSLQLRLPASAIKIGRKAAADQAQFYRAEMAKNPDVPLDQYIRRLMTPGGRVVFSACRPMGSDQITTHLSVQEGQGYTILSATADFRPENPKQSAPLKTPPKTSDQPVIAHLARDYRKEWKPSAEVLDALKHPDRNDPLDLAFRSRVKTLTDESGGNVVACLPDESLAPFLRDLNLTHFVKGKDADLLGNQSEYGMVIRQDADCLRIEPVRPALAITDRVDRAALAKFTQAIMEDEGPSFDSVAAYTADVPQNEFGLAPFTEAWLGGLRPGMAQQARQMSETARMLRVLRDLPTAAWKAMVDGPVPISTIDPGLLGRFGDLFTKPTISRVESMAGVVPHYPIAGVADPTDLANLKSFDLALQARIAFAPYIWCQAANGGDGFEATPENIAANYWNDKGIDPRFEEDNRFRPFGSRNLKAAFRIGYVDQLGAPGILALQIDLLEMLPIKGSSFDRFDRLPASYRQAVEEAYRARSSG